MVLKKLEESKAVECQTRDPEARGTFSASAFSIAAILAKRNAHSSVSAAAQDANVLDNLLE
jgi:hypothetical protein